MVISLEFDFPALCWQSPSCPVNELLSISLTSSLHVLLVISQCEHQPKQDFKATAFSPESGPTELITGVKVTLMCFGRGCNTPVADCDLQTNIWIPLKSKPAFRNRDFQPLSSSREKTSNDSKKGQSITRESERRRSKESESAKSDAPPPKQTATGGHNRRSERDGRLYQLQLSAECTRSHSRSHTDLYKRTQDGLKVRGTRRVTDRG